MAFSNVSFFFSFFFVAKLATVSRPKKIKMAAYSSLMVDYCMPDLVPQPKLSANCL